MSPLSQRDRFLLCSDGVHGVLDDRRLADLLAREAAPDEIARSVVDTALAAGSSDNVTALVLDVLDVPAAEAEDLQPAIATLPLLALPKQGETIDGFRLDALLSDGRYSRLFRATDRQNERAVVLKFRRRASPKKTRLGSRSCAKPGSRRACEAPASAR